MGLLEEGQTIRDTYEVERFLGEGAFAEVYRVKHRFLGRQAMKVFKMTGMTLAETEEILSEAILLSQLDHPHIIRVFDANTTETSRGASGFFTMEYVAGGSLAQFWKSHGKRFVPIPTSVDILVQCCRGLAVAHGKTPPIIHRDIKPQNILVGYHGDGIRARVSDFGLAKRVNPLTLMASSRGTRSCKAPEAFTDLQSDSCAGDVWALGSSLYLLLTDRLPYDDGAPDLGDLFRFDQPLVPPSVLNVHVDPLLDQIVCKSLAIRAKDRHPSAQDLLKDLNDWKSRPPKESTESGSLEEASKTVLGIPSPVNEAQARKMAHQAFELARSHGSLREAADLLEESFNQFPTLRDQYKYWATLWRKGIAG